MLIIILLIEDRQREPTKKPEAIASGFSLSLELKMTTFAKNCPKNLNILVHIIKGYIFSIKNRANIKTCY